MVVPILGTIVPKMGTMEEVTSVADALFGRTRRQVLGLVLSHPEHTFYVRQMARLLGVGHGALQRELANLASGGILLRQAQGRQIIYRANPACPIYDELRGLLLKTVGLVDTLRQALAQLDDGIEVAFVYGSLAKGAETNRSDVDVMVIGSVTLGQVAAALNPTQDILRREVNPSVYPPHELGAKARAGHHFVTTVLREPKVFIIGGQDDLDRVVAAGMADESPDIQA
jgi:predicted nucleotidyltransferase